MELPIYGSVILLVGELPPAKSAAEKNKQEELLLDENLRREIGTKARMRVQEYYAIDNYVNQLVSYYEKLRKEG